MSLYKFELQTAFDALVKKVPRATILAQGSLRAGPARLRKCCDANARAQQKKWNAVGEVEVSRSWITLANSTAFYRIM